MKTILVAGGIAVGKTTVSEHLAVAGYEIIRVRAALASVLGIDHTDRRTLQIEGAALDKRTSGRWLVEYLQEQLEVLPRPVVVDSLRTLRQTVPILVSIPEARLVYLAARSTTRRERYQLSAARDQLKATVSYDVATEHETERQADELRDLASLIVETDELTAGQVVREILIHIG